MIDEKDVQHIAQLARLKISAEDALIYADQLSKVLSHFDKISKIDTTGVEPLVTPSEIEIYLRNDEVIKDETTEQLMKNAPEKSGHLFKVPPVV